MRKSKSVLLVLVLMLAGGSGLAAADPDPDPATSPVLAEVTLTTIPHGWSGRHDLRPELEVFPDGRAIKKPDAAAAGRAPEVPPQQLNGSLRADVLRAAQAEIRALSTVDLGEPAVTDESKQIIDLMPAERGQEVHLILYAPGFTEGLSPEQQDGRIRFAALYRRLFDAFVQD
ncbi:hypothetical protein [Nocardia goodfellowii]|uniref:ABC-type glycerol-3-phosphate transport system substrate-binding protein n=1 Tax=Nocardia goodfellowii TaxID=882446 RepID=A0ABS4QHS4_9NOCA|nr:hypothetical protein [Nocardia goodfellowii]MBP2190658.1 ABC-type glycerol-3-phosphate transport system substrate-binding protein [Nocardia goodfellowii]